MFFYIATALERVADMKALRNRLEALGHRCSYDWSTHGSVQTCGPARIREVARKEVKGVLNADCVIVLLPGGRGTHAELGIAIGCGDSAYGSEILLVGEQKDASGRECAFYYHPAVTRVPDVDAALAVIAKVWP